MVTGGILFLNQSRIIRIFDFSFIYFFSFSLLFLLITASPFQFIDAICLFFIGTNPIILYGLNRTNKSSLIRATSFALPLWFSKEDELRAEYYLRDTLSGTSKVLIEATPQIGSGAALAYNDIFLNNSLALEFIWDSLAEHAMFFPDWYALFYTDRGMALLYDVVEGDRIAFHGWAYMYFDSSIPAIAGGMVNGSILPIDLADCFSASVVERYFPKSRYLTITQI